MVGVLEVFHRSALDIDEEWLSYLSGIAQQAAIAIDNAKLFQELEKSNLNLIVAYDSTLEGWSHALGLRDRETDGHSKRVVDLTIETALQMGIPSEELVHIRRGALLHDIGKMGIPDSILLKPGVLTPEERVTMEIHPVLAQNLLSSIEYLHPAMDIPYNHHEKWDGTGYPNGLKGQNIPLQARIFAVVDVYDALTSDRPYRKAWSEKDALEYIAEQSGKFFDPDVVDIFLKLFVKRDIYKFSDNDQPDLF
jgi:HD-GYP domain-containing protein (c-di-GMP phosphodiesterase class II)